MTNIAEIIKNMPKGRELYSTVMGYCNAVVTDSNNIKISREGYAYMLNQYGIFNIGGTAGECVLWPNDTTKTWDNWQKHLVHRGDYVVFKDGAVGRYNIIAGDNIVRWATEKEIKSYNKNNETLRVSIGRGPQLGEVVLARGSNEGTWNVTLYGYQRAAISNTFVCSNGTFAEIAPIQGNEKIVGTKNEPKVYIE